LDVVFIVAIIKIVTRDKKKNKEDKSKC
jgi:hypothetical protein